MERKIIHIDMDAFYASIEQRDQPALRGKPVIVGGSPESRGVVAAASYEARKYGVRSAMSCARAARLCPHAIFVPPRFAAYREASGKMQAILREITDLVEPLALDEAYLDVTQNKMGEPSATRLAIYLKSRIKGQLRLTASAGVAPNKFLAKLASEWKKPDGLHVIAPHQVEEAVRDLPVEKLWGVGPATAAKLEKCGWGSTADLRRVSLAELSTVLGATAPFIRGLAFGEDSRQVVSERKLRSRGAETTFEKDVLDITSLEATLEKLTARVAQSLNKNELAARTLCVKLRYGDFSTITRSRTFSSSSTDAVFFFQQACDLVRHHTEAGRIPVRLIGFSVSGFEAPEEETQLVLPIENA